VTFLGTASTRYRAFVAHRARLNTVLLETAEEIDGWIAAHELGATLRELAELEGMLAKRRDSLQELAELDDKFMNHLVELLSASG